MDRRTDRRSPIQPGNQGWDLPILVAFIAAVAWWSFQQPDLPVAPEKVLQPQEQRRARANLVELLSTDDYPIEAIRHEEQGTVAFRLTVSPMGRVTDCDVTASSGSALLDRTTCNIMRRRARFEPAIGPDGQAVADTVVSRVRWELPQE